MFESNYSKMQENEFYALNRCFEPTSQFHLTISLHYILVGKHKLAIRVRAETIVVIFNFFHLHTVFRRMNIDSGTRIFRFKNLRIIVPHCGITSSFIACFWCRVTITIAIVDFNGIIS